MSLPSGHPALRRLVPLAITLAAGCALLPGGKSDDPEQEPNPRKFVIVQNRHWSDVRISAIRSGARYRLGTVHSMHTDTLVIPSVITSGIIDLQFLAEPIGSSSHFLSERVRVGPGEDVELRIANELGHSAVSVF